MVPTAPRRRIAILIGLFLFQQKGTEMVGALFGPITIVWFAVLALLGISNIASYAGVLHALNPWYAVAFFAGSLFLFASGGQDATAGWHRAALQAVVEEDVVELGAPHLIGEGKIPVPGLIEIQRHGLLVLGRIEFRAILEHGNELNFFGDTELFEQRQVQRQ